MGLDRMEDDAETNERDQTPHLLPFISDERFCTLGLAFLDRDAVFASL